jgi:hypothetical protein
MTENKAMAKSFAAKQVVTGAAVPISQPGVFPLPKADRASCTTYFWTP